MAYRPLVQQEGLWLPEGAVAESHARQARAAMEHFGEPEVIQGPFDKLGRFLNFGRYALYGYGHIRDSS